jgi:hypothetical protein
MLVNNRIIHKDNTTLRDLSINLNDLYAGNGTLDIVAAQDKVFIGSDMPFNHRYFCLATANDQASVVSVDIWDGSTWRAAVDVLDQTKDANGKTLAQTGIISWAVDKDYGWGFEETTEDISDLSTLKIYNMYWVRLSFSADLKATTALSYVGHKFANDSQLEGYYPDLNRSALKTAFKAAKTTWDDQHVLAAEEIIRDLRKKKVILSRNQILDFESFNDAAVHKCAEIIMRGLGDDYAENRASAIEDYKEALDKVYFPVDKDGDGKLDTEERTGYSVGIFRR